MRRNAQPPAYGLGCFAAPDAGICQAPGCRDVGCSLVVYLVRGSITIIQLCRVCAEVADAPLIRVPIDAAATDYSDLHIHSSGCRHLGRLPASS
jgi:hypothetical protein